MSGSGTVHTGLALDARALDGLRRNAGRDPQAAVRQAAGQFEALFMQQLMKSMRAAMPRSGMFEGPGHETYVGMLDQQMAQKIAERPGGLADMIAQQLTRHMAPAGAAPAAASVDGRGVAAGEASAATLALSSSTRGLPASALPGLMGDVRPADPTPVRAAVDAAFDAARAGVGVASSAARAGAHALRNLAAATREGASSGVRSVAGLAQPAPSLEPAAAARLKATLARRLDGPQAGFIEKMWPHAIEAQRSTGVPAAFVVGQAALESGWGKHEIRHADGRSAHNLFGIKATGGWKGGTVEVMTTEYVDGKPKKVVEKFRAYGSYAEAFQDWAKLMSGSSRYGGVVRAGQSVEGFAQGMQRAGYATDPRYGDKLERTINQTLLFRRLVV